MTKTTGETDMASQRDWEGSQPEMRLPHGKPAPPLDGNYPALAIEVRRLLGWYADDDREFLSSRDAARKTGLANTTISNLTRGDRVNPEKLRALTKLGGDYSRLLSLAGYIPETADPMKTLGLALPTALFTGMPVAALSESGLGDAGKVGDVVPEGLSAIELRTDALSPDFLRGDVLFVREFDAPLDGQKVVATVGGVVTVGVYRHTTQGDYLSSVNGGRRLSDGPFNISGVIEYYLRRA